jgi:transcription elongation GreA/GreB family factor
MAKNLNKKAGQIVEVNAPAGSFKVTVLKVE